MALPTKPNINDITQIELDVRDLTAQITANMGDVKKSIKEGVLSSLGDVANSIKRSIDLTTKFRDGLVNTKDIQKELLKIDQKRGYLILQQNVARERGNQILVQGLEAAIQEIDKLEDHLRNLNEFNDKKIEKKIGLLGAILDKFKGIPVIGKLFNMDEALKTMKLMAIEGKGFGAILGGGIGTAFKSLGGVLVILKIIYEIAQFIVGLMTKSDVEVTSLAKSMNISKDAAADLRDYLISIKSTSDSIFMTTKAMVQAQLDLNNALGVSTIFSKDIIRNAVTLVENIGLAKEEAQGLNEIAIRNNENAEENNLKIADAVSGFKQQTGIAFQLQKVMGTVSKISGQLYFNLKGNVVEMTKAVLKASSLGITLEKAKSIADSFLDFQSSIDSELEAELITGKELNIERARGLALQGKYAESAEEIVKQVGPMFEAAKDNVIAQQMIAKAAGMTADELSDAIRLQKLYGQISKSDLTAIGGIELANKIKINWINGQNLLDSIKSASIQDKFTKSLERAQEIFSDLVDGGTLDKLADYLVNITTSLSKNGVISTIFGNGMANAEIENSTKTNQGYFSSVTKDKQEEIAKDVYKNLSLWNRFTNQLAYNFKNPITAIGNPAKGGFVAEEMLKNEAIDKHRLDVKDFTISTHPKDTLVMAGGTKLGDDSKETNTLLRQLLDVIKNGGNVYIDGQKAGTAMVMGTHKSA